MIFTPARPTSQKFFREAFKMFLLPMMLCSMSLKRCLLIVQTQKLLQHSEYIFMVISVLLKPQWKYFETFQIRFDPCNFQNQDKLVCDKQKNIMTKKGSLINVSTFFPLNVQFCWNNNYPSVAPILIILCLIVGNVARITLGLIDNSPPRWLLTFRIIIMPGIMA